MESIFLKLAQYPIVETERLLLRPVTLDDAEAMFEYASDKDNPASGKVMEKSGMRFSHEEAYACMDRHEEGRIVTRVHYVLTKEDYFANK